MRTINKIGIADIRQFKLLLVRNEGTVKLIMPGGTVEDGENDLETLQREIQEELKSTVIPETITYIGQYEDVAANEPDAMVQITLYGGEIAAPFEMNEEIVEMIWFDPEVDDYNRLSAIVRNKIIPDLKEKGLLINA